MSEPNDETTTRQPPQAGPAQHDGEERTDSYPHPAGASDQLADQQRTQYVTPPQQPGQQHPQQPPQPQQQVAAQQGHPAPGPVDAVDSEAPTRHDLPPVVPPGDPAHGAPQAWQAPYDQHQQPFPPLTQPPWQQHAPDQQPQPGVDPRRQQRRGRHAATGPEDLASAHLIRPVKRRPQSGWRKAVYVGSGRLINPGESPADRQRRELIARVNQPLRGCYKIAMLSLKGGVGKTTTTTTLGSTFASLRGDRVVAIDANPDRGTLSQKIPMETTATVRHLLRDADRITRYSDIRAYTSQGSSRLEILASEQDPAVSEAFSEQDYRRAVDLLEHFYNIVLTDCGTGLMHSAMKGVLDVADSLVLVSSASVDGARSASATLDWLDAHGYGGLVQRSVAVINSVRPKASSVDLDKLEAHFGARTRAVCRIPFDPHLEEGAEIDLDQLHDNTRLKLLELASTVADGFAVA
ncbi:AAA family ATPase [Haloechinothrix sp. LS1_15]|uniref:MinD/ParA family ATP-binding protein n=1 Tax=Haloechinothrix sp. LS1_15 TaxID=2652248 RepID=UPI00294AF03E|nr:AAA family ATPase [Haloechinothrix sp. LS1_15]